MYAACPAAPAHWLRRDAGERPLPSLVAHMPRLTACDVPADPEGAHIVEVDADHGQTGSITIKVTCC